MRILLVLAHDKKDSLSATLADHCANNLTKQGHEVDYLSLYDYADQIPFYSHDKELMAQSAFYALTRHKIMAADRLIVVFPVYWYATPGILKCWFDLITNYAWNYPGAPARYALAKHAIKKSFVISTTMSPRLYTLWIGNPAQNAIRQTLLWMGMGPVLAYEIGSVQKTTPSDLESYKKKIDNYLSKLVG